MAYPSVYWVSPIPTCGGFVHPQYHFCLGGKGCLFAMFSAETVGESCGTLCKSYIKAAPSGFQKKGQSASSRLCKCQRKLRRPGFVLELKGDNEDGIPRQNAGFGVLVTFELGSTNRILRSPLKDTCRQHFSKGTSTRGTDSSKTLVSYACPFEKPNVSDSC